MNSLRAACRSVLGRPSVLASHAPRRNMGGSAAHAGNPDDFVTYAGLTLKKPSAWEYAGSKALGAVMWFWVFYRTYHDWDLRVHGLAYVLEKDDHGDHGHDDHDSH